MTAALDAMIPAEPGAEFNDVLLATERQVLGGVLLSPPLMDTLSGALDVAHFRDPLHQAIYTRMIDLYGRGKPIDARSFMQAITDDKALAVHQRRVILQYMPQMISDDMMGVVGPMNEGIEYIRKAAARRLAGQMAARLHHVSADASPDEIGDVLDRMRDAFAGAVAPAKSSRNGMGDILEAHLSQADNPIKPVIVPTPYADLTAILAGGFYAGQLIVIGARPAVGKSVVGLDIAREAAKTGNRVLMISLEMLESEIAARFLAATARVPLNRTRQIPTDPDVLTEEDWRRLGKVASQFAELNEHLLVVDPAEMDESGLFSVATLRRHLTSMRKLGTPADIVVLDYLQLVEASRRAENRQVEVAEISRALKLLAIEFKIPIVVLAQLNRGPEQRQDKRPMVSDLRESGAVEQDADVVILLHREDVYDRESPRAGEMDLIVGKNRNGPPGTITTAFQGHYARAVDMAKDAA